MINPRQLYTHIITPVLNALDFDKGNAAQQEVRAALILGTFAQESACGQYLKQIEGPALGIGQMEPATHDDIWNNWLIHQPFNLKAYMAAQCGLQPGQTPNAHFMIGNLWYATAMTACHYRRVPEALPRRADVSVEALAHYWKTYYNTKLGKGKVEHFMQSWVARDCWTVPEFELNKIPRFTGG